MTWLPVTTTVEPASEPVTASEAKAQCRITGTSEDTLIANYIKAARRLAERVTGTRFVSQTVDFRGSSFKDLGALPVAPIISITSVKYLDTQGVEQTLSTDVYELVSTGLAPSIRLKFGQNWPGVYAVPDAVRVIAVVGYLTIPEEVRHAILLTVAKWFDSREDGELSAGALALLESHR